MARLPRLILADQPHHIILRGNNRQAIFRDDEDRRRWLDLLEQHARAQGVDIHAYVLMDNHVHLLLTPEVEAEVAAAGVRAGTVIQSRSNPSSR